MEDKQFVCKAIVKQTTTATMMNSDKYSEAQILVFQRVDKA